VSHHSTQTEHLKSYSLRETEVSKSLTTAKCEINSGIQFKFASRYHQLIDYWCRQPIFSNEFGPIIRSYLPHLYSKQVISKDPLLIAEHHPSPKSPVPEFYILYLHGRSRIVKISSPHVTFQLSPRRRLCLWVSVALSIFCSRVGQEVANSNLYLREEIHILNLKQRGGADVFALDYHLAPEYPLPNAVKARNRLISNSDESNKTSHLSFRKLSKRMLIC